MYDHHASDRYGILWETACAVGAKDEYDMPVRYVSAAAVQADLRMGSDVEKTVFISGQGTRTMRRPIWHRSRALCSKVGV